MKDKLAIDSGKTNGTAVVVGGCLREEAALASPPHGGGDDDGGREAGYMCDVVFLVGAVHQHDIVEAMMNC